MARVKACSTRQDFERRLDLENDLQNVTVYIFKKIDI